MEATTYNVVDTVVSILLIIFFLIGWKKGFLRSLIGPICFGIFAIIGIIVYDATDNLFRALTVVVMGTLISSLVINLLAFLAQKTVDPNERGKKLLLSRLVGGILNLSWKTMILAASLILLCEISYIYPQWRHTGATVEASASYKFITRYFVYRSPRAKQVINTIAILRNPDLLAEVKNTEEFRAFYDTPKVRNILGDVELRRQIREGEIKNVLENPLIKNMMEDDDLMKKLSRLSQAAYRAQNPPEAAPHRLGH